jgi:hypothetical protein
MRWNTAPGSIEKVIEVTAARTKRAIVYLPGSRDGFDRDDLSHAATNPDPSDVIATVLSREDEGRRPGGFGMLIVRQIVDDSSQRAGNEVLLIKYLS